MNSILDFLNQPIVLTLVTLTVGSYLLSLVAERRARNDGLREKAIEFLIEAGNHINEFAPHIYAQLRRERIEVDQAIHEGLKNMFARRMSVEIGSQVYLKSQEFFQQYCRLQDELAGVVACITELEQGGASEETILKIQQHRQRLGDSWPLAGESPGPNASRPVDELIQWMDMILHRTTHLLSSHLKSVIR